MSQAGTAFSFLDIDTKLKHNFAEAEKHATSSPDSAVRAARVFAELLLERVAELRGHPRQTINGEEESFFKFTNRLRDQEKCILPADAALLHAIRDMGNDASHGEKIFTPAEGRAAFQNISQLALRFQADIEDRAAGASDSASAAAANENAKTNAFSASDNVYEFVQAFKRTPPPPPPEYDVHTSGPSVSNGAIISATIFACVALAIFLVWHNNSPSPMPMAAQPEQSAQQVAPSAPTFTAFSSPQTYVVVPGGHLKDANERSGAGTGYGVANKLTRGAQVVGTGVAVDPQGTGWIQLTDGNYIKESLLIPYTPPASPAAAPTAAPPPDATATSDDSSAPPQAEQNDGDADTPTVPAAPPQQPQLVQYQVCPPPGTPLPCQLAYAQAGAPPPQFEYPEGYQPPTYPAVGQPQIGVAPQGVPGPAVTFSFHIGSGHKHP